MHFIHYLVTYIKQLKEPFKNCGGYSCQDYFFFVKRKIQKITKNIKILNMKNEEQKDFMGKSAQMQTYVKITLHSEL